MKKPEKVKVKVGCLAFGTVKYLRNSVLSGAEITPEILLELASGSGTLEVVNATPVEKPTGLKTNEEASPPDNTRTKVVLSVGEDGVIASEKENNNTDTEMDSKVEIKESTENDSEETEEKVVAKKAPTVSKKKTVGESKGNKKR